MPKVTDEYLADKRSFIIDCTGEILKEKPLYLVTMRDIIKKAGFSQGAIYRYYSGLDEIYIDYINQHTANRPLEEKIETLLHSSQAEKTILADCLVAMGTYLEELLKSVVGKTFFELTVLYAYDPEKIAAVLPQLKFKQSLETAQKKIIDYTLQNVEAGVFKPQIPIRSIMLFTGSFIDGVAQSVAINTDLDQNYTAASDIPEMFRTLAKAVAGFLEE